MTNNPARSRQSPTMKLPEFHSPHEETSMQKRMWIAAGVAAVALGTLTVAAGKADDPEKIIVPKKIQDDVNKMADVIAKGQAVDKEADAFAKANKDNLKKTMWIFKPRFTGDLKKEKGDGGFGVGKQGMYENDGIEDFIDNQAGKKPEAINLAKSAADINRLADITLAISAIAEKYKPTKKEEKKDPADWTAANKDLQKAAMDLKAAVKSSNQADMQKAFKNLSASCTKCHDVFRE
jgi:cytochrome c556